MAGGMSGRRTAQGKAMCRAWRRAWRSLYFPKCHSQAANLNVAEPFLDVVREGVADAAAQAALAALAGIGVITFDIVVLSTTCNRREEEGGSHLAVAAHTEDGVTAASHAEAGPAVPLEGGPDGDAE